MTTILPAETSPWQVIDKAIGNQISHNLPGAVQQGYQRQLGLNALDQAQADIAQAGGDPYKIALAFAKAGAQNPNLERSLGPLMQTAMQAGRVQNAFGPAQPGGGSVSPSQIQPQLPGQIPGQTGQLATRGAMGEYEPVLNTERLNRGEFATPTPFNIMTVQDIDAESKRYAQSVNDPAAYATRMATLQAQNEMATQQRQALEQAALNAKVPPSELPRFMVTNQHLDPRNPAEWAQQGVRNYAEVKNNDDKLRRAFIPGIGNGLLGQNRDQAIKNLGPAVRDNAKRGLEQEDRKFLAENYVTPTEIESLYHPPTPKLEKAISSVPKGIFPAQKKKTWGDVADVYRGKMDKNPFVSYEEAVERDPQAMQIMQDNLANFFTKNVDKDTSLLGVRQELWDKKDYDWRQIGPAIRQAEKNGLKLQPFQQRELDIIETQPPLQSLPDIFKDWSRIENFFRGGK